MPEVRWRAGAAPDDGATVRRQRAGRAREAERRYRGARIPTPWNIDSTADPRGLRTQRAGQQGQLTIERVQQALA
jgi:hypothetical protein